MHKVHHTLHTFDTENIYTAKKLGNICKSSCKLNYIISQRHNVEFVDTKKGFR